MRIEFLDLQKSTAKWNTEHPELLDQARRNIGTCPICDGVGIITEDGETSFYCACKVVEREHRLAARFSLLSHVSIEERKADFSDLKPWGDKEGQKTFTSAANAMMQMARYPDSWVVLIGNRGCGKSHLMLSAYRTLEKRAAYVYVPKLADDFHTAIGTRSVSDLVDAFAEVPVLFLDDLGAEHAGSDFTASVLDNIVQRRYQWRKLRPTAVATNLSRKQLNERYPRLASRILDWQLSQVFVINLGDYRQQDAEEQEDTGKPYGRIVR